MIRKFTETSFRYVYIVYTLRKRKMASSPHSWISGSLRLQKDIVLCHDWLKLTESRLLCSRPTSPQECGVELICANHAARGGVSAARMGRRKAMHWGEGFWRARWHGNLYLQVKKEKHEKTIANVCKLSALGSRLHFVGCTLHRKDMKNSYVC